MNDPQVPATKQASPQQVLAAFFEKHKGQIAAALPKHLTPDRMIRLTLTEFSKNRTLQECDIRTIFGAVVQASQMGLEIGVAGQGYLVPYKDRRRNVTVCQFIPGWQGIVDLVSRSGRATVWTGAVFEGDEFEFRFGIDPDITHIPCGEDDPRLLTHVYAVGWVKDAQRPVIDVWPMRKVLKHRDRNNKVGESHYSFAHPEMYARKLPLLQVMKYMPKSIEVATALDLASREDADTIDVSGAFIGEDEGPATTQSASEKVKEAAKEKAASRKATRPEAPTPPPPADGNQPPTGGEMFPE